MALEAKAINDRGESTPVLIFDDATANLIEVDYRGSRGDVLKRLFHELPARVEPEAVRGRGRPRLGVVAREVTLLPRHWQWLSSQPGGDVLPGGESSAIPAHGSEISYTTIVAGSRVHIMPLLATFCRDFSL